jgi:hypothetical protein
MAQAVLSHTASRLVSRDELATIPAGDPVGPRHKPVAHIELVTTVRDAFAERGYAVEREHYSVTRDGARLFGTLDLKPVTGRSLTDGMDGGMAVRLRHSNDAAFALGVIAGVRVFVCDNLVFSGGESLLRRKQTTGLDLDREVHRGMGRAFASYGDLDRLLASLKNTELTDDQVRLAIYNLVLDGEVLPPSQLGKVHSWYFHADEIASDADTDRGLDDVAQRTAYGVMSAMTRVARDFSPHRQQDVGIAVASHLEGYFGMTPDNPRIPTRARPVFDTGEFVIVLPTTPRSRTGPAGTST